jgi:ribonuclease D
LLIWRNAEAQRRDRPLFKIVNDQTLVALALTQPESEQQMLGIRGLKPWHLRRYGRKIVRAVQAGLKTPAPEPPPRSPRPPDEVIERYEALRAWRKKMAAGRGVDPDVVVSNAVLHKLAKRVPRSPDQLADLRVLGPWKQKAYGTALLAVLQRHP